MTLRKSRNQSWANIYIYTILPFLAHFRDSVADSKLSLPTKSSVIWYIARHAWHNAQKMEKKVK